MVGSVSGTLFCIQCNDIDYLYSSELAPRRRSRRGERGGGEDAVPKHVGSEWIILSAVS